MDCSLLRINFGTKLDIRTSPFLLNPSKNSVMKSRKDTAFIPSTPSLLIIITIHDIFFNQENEYLLSAFISIEAIWIDPRLKFVNLRKETSNFLSNEEYNRIWIPKFIHYYNGLENEMNRKSKIDVAVQKSVNGNPSPYVWTEEGLL